MCRASEPSVGKVRGVGGETEGGVTKKRNILEARMVVSITFGAVIYNVISLTTLTSRHKFSNVSPSNSNGEPNTTSD